MSRKKKRYYLFNLSFLLATGIVIMIGIAMMTYNSKKSLKPLDGNVFAKDGEGIYIEQLQLSKGSLWSKVDSIPVFVYRGRIYERNEWNPLSYDVAKNLVGDQVGTTTDSLADWSLGGTVTDKLPSNMGVSSIYKMNGYDTRFRLMTIDEKSKIGWMYECLNNVYINDGACLFEALHLRGNIKSVSYQSMEEWNDSSDEFHEADVEEFATFVDKLYEAKLINYGRDTNPNLYEKDRKIYYLTMKDGTRNELIVFSDGYVSYQGLAVYNVFELK